MHSVAEHQKIEGGKFLFSEKNLTVPKKLKGGTFWDFPTSILTQNSKKKFKGGPFGEKFPKKCHSAEKTERGTLWDFPTSILTQNSRKIEGGTLWGKNFRKKSRSAEKIERGTTKFYGVKMNHLA